MKIIRLAVALCCTALLAACFPPSTDHPIGGLHAGVDRALLGTWNAKMEEADKGDDAAIFKFAPRTNNTMTVRIDSAKKKAEDRMIAIVSAARVGGNRFLNTTLVMMGDKKDSDDNDKQRGSLPVLYRFEGRTLVLYLMDEDATKAAIKAGKIKGEIEPGQFGDAIITADQRSLDAFMASPQGAALFNQKFATLTRAY